VVRAARPEGGTSRRLSYYRLGRVGGGFSVNVAGQNRPHGAGGVGEAGRTIGSGGGVRGGVCRRGRRGAAGAVGPLCRRWWPSLALRCGRSRRIGGRRTRRNNTRSGGRYSRQRGSAQERRHDRGSPLFDGYAQARVAGCVTWWRLLIDRATDVADQGSGHDRSLTDSPPFLKINAYHPCETPLVQVGAC